MKVAEAMFPSNEVLSYTKPHVADADLLATITGDQKSAAKLIELFGSFSEIARLPSEELAKHMTKNRAVKLAAALELGRRSMVPKVRDLKLDRPENVFKYLKPIIGHLSMEVFYVLMLDARCKLMSSRMVAQGGLAACAVDPRDVFEHAIREKAPSIILAHNHPSGDPTPSRDDIDLTRRLGEGARTLGISLIDHVVVSDGGFASLAEMGKL